MDTQSVTNDPRAHTDGDSGAIGGLDACERSNRVDALANGLAALSMIFDSAMNCEEEHQSMPMVWADAFNLVRMLAKDIKYENNAIWNQLRPHYAVGDLAEAKP